MSATPVTEKRVSLAAVAGAHGIKGEVRLKLFTDDVAKLKSARVLLLDGVERRLVSARPGGKFAVAKFEGIDDRTQAESLRSMLVEVEAEALPPLEEGEYYHADLIGLNVVDEHDEAVGKVVAIENYGATDIVEVELPDGKRFMAPLTKQAVPEWDDRRLVMMRDFVDP